jgi:hypothetical protein
VVLGSQLGAIKEVARGRLDGPELGARHGADAGSGADGPLERAVLLDVVAVGAKGGVRRRGRRGPGLETGREGARGGGRVGLGGLIDGLGSRPGSTAEELDRGGAVGCGDGRLAEGAGYGEHCEMAKGVVP